MVGTPKLVPKSNSEKKATYKPSRKYAKATINRNPTLIQTAIGLFIFFKKTDLLKIHSAGLFMVNRFYLIQIERR